MVYIPQKSSQTVNSQTSMKKSFKVEKSWDFFSLHEINSKILYQTQEIHRK